MTEGRAGPKSRALTAATETGQPSSLMRRTRDERPRQINTDQAATALAPIALATSCDHDPTANVTHRRDACVRTTPGALIENNPTEDQVAA